MTFINWTSKNEIEIPAIDNQHRKLFELLNRLHAAVSAGQEQTAIKSVLDDLIDYTVYHFNTEEKYFQAVNYPLFQEHKEEHDRLTQQALELQRQINAGSATISFELLDFLHDWLTDHTSGLDMEFGNFIRANEIQLD